MQSDYALRGTHVRVLPIFLFISSLYSSDLASCDSSVPHTRS